VDSSSITRFAFKSSRLGGNSGSGRIFPQSNKNGTFLKCKKVAYSSVKTLGAFSNWQVGMKIGRHGRNTAIECGAFWQILKLLLWRARFLRRGLNRLRPGVGPWAELERRFGMGPGQGIVQSIVIAPSPSLLNWLQQFISIYIIAISPLCLPPNVSFAQQPSFYARQRSHGVS
jgi:hypothetical protein